MRRYTQSLTVMGYVTESNPDASMFKVKARSGDEFDAYVTMQTFFDVLQNLDSLGNDRVPNPDGKPPQTCADLVRKYIIKDQLIIVQGVLQVDGDKRRFDARTVTLQSSVKDKYLFQETHWWLTQTARLAESSGSIPCSATSVLMKSTIGSSCTAISTSWVCPQMTIRRNAPFFRD